MRAKELNDIKRKVLQYGIDSAIELETLDDEAENLWIRLLEIRPWDSDTHFINLKYMICKRKSSEHISPYIKQIYPIIRKNQTKFHMGDCLELKRLDELRELREKLEGNTWPNNYEEIFKDRKIKFKSTQLRDLEKLTGRGMSYSQGDNHMEEEFSPPEADMQFDDEPAVYGELVDTIREWNRQRREYSMKTIPRIKSFHWRKIRVGLAPIYREMEKYIKKVNELYSSRPKDVLRNMMEEVYRQMEFSLQKRISEKIGKVIPKLKKEIQPKFDTKLTQQSENEIIILMKADNRHRKAYELIMLIRELRDLAIARRNGMMWDDSVQGYVTVEGEIHVDNGIMAIKENKIAMILDSEEERFELPIQPPLNNYDMERFILSWDVEEEMEKFREKEDNKRREITKKIDNRINYRIQREYAEDAKRTYNRLIKDASPRCEITPERLYQEFKEKWKGDGSTFDGEDFDVFTLPKTMNEEMKTRFLDDIIDLKKMTAVIRSRGNLSAPGMDYLTNPILKMEKDAAAKMMVAFMKLILKAEKVPDSWKDARTILIHKGGDVNDIKNWRPITITSVIYRLCFCRFAQSIRTVYANEGKTICDENQKGFVPGIDGCGEHIAIANELINNAVRKDESIYVLALDLRDAFGSIPHELIRKNLLDIEVPLNLVNLIMDSYEGATIKILTKGG
jgi:hypothetical protein